MWGAVYGQSRAMFQCIGPQVMLPRSLTLDKILDLAKPHIPHLQL